MTMSPIEKKKIRKRLDELVSIELRIAELQSIHRRLVQDDAPRWADQELVDLKDEVSLLREMITALFVKTGPTKEEIEKYARKGT